MFKTSWAQLLQSVVLYWGNFCIWHWWETCLVIITGVGKQHPVDMGATKHLTMPMLASPDSLKQTTFNPQTTISDRSITCPSVDSDWSNLNHYLFLN